MKEKLIAFAQMTRLKESLPVLVSSTLLGVASTQFPLDWGVVLVLLANTLVSCAGFTLHALQFAPLAILDPEKRLSNPIAAGVFSTKVATLLSAIFGLIAIFCYAILGTKTLITGLVLIIIITLINWRKLGLHRRFTLKPGPYQWLVHGFFALFGSLVFDIQPDQATLLVIFFVMALLFYTNVIDQNREPQSKAVQRRLTIISFVSLSVAGIIGFSLFFVFGLLPIWVLLLFIVLTSIMVAPNFLERRREKQLPIFSPGIWRSALFRSAAISLAVHFIAPSLYQLFK